MFALTRRRRQVDIWPGFVDALGALLLVVIFVILVFTLGHFALSETLSGRERVLAQLNTRVAALAKLLSLEEAETAALRREIGEVRATLTRTEETRAGLAAELGDARTALAAATREAAALGAALDESRRAEAVQAELTARAEAQVELLGRQVAALSQQLSEIAAALDLSRQTVATQEAQIADLGRQLNIALAERVRELARYRSEFFGRLREALGDRPGIRIEGDRFVLQSELLFDTASAELETAGRAQVEQLARTLTEIAAIIPRDLEWVLRIDGHTDRRPISTERFPSNWELSTARAVAIVHYLQALGVPPDRLAATGFGEFHPLDPADREAAWARNRRIELKLTNR